MLASTGRALSVLCHLLASTANYSFPRRGTVSAPGWNTELRCWGWWKNPDGRDREGCADTPSCAGQLHPAALTSDTAYALPCLCSALQRAGSISLLIWNNYNIFFYYSEACADFGCFFVSPQSCACGVLCPGAARGQGLLSWAVQAVEGCLPFPIFQVSPLRLCIAPSQDLSQAEGGHLFSKAVQYIVFVCHKSTFKTDK